MSNEIYSAAEENHGYAGEKELDQLPNVDDIPPTYAASSSACQLYVTPAARQGPAGPYAPVRSDSVLNMAATRPLNHVSLFSKRNAVSGSYLIDPLLSVSAVAASAYAENSLRKLNWEHTRNIGAGSGFGDWVQGQLNTPEVNAAFRTRNSAINVQIGIVSAQPDSGRPGEMQQARVMASSRHGNISVNLFEIQQGRCVDLNVSTRSGNIIVLLPPNFAGPITIRQKHGHNIVKFLPAFAERAGVLRTSDRETVVVLSPATSMLESPSKVTGNDLCIVGTRAGRVTFGISGLDGVDHLANEGFGLLDLLGECLQVGVQTLEDALIRRRNRFHSSIRQRYLRS